MSSRTWIFGYGSLIWRPDFRFDESQPACLVGWTRRFWQGSPDHRGTEDRPGRVVTLITSPGECCWGKAFRLPIGAEESILAGLDIREQGGYERLVCDVGFPDGRSVAAVTYFACSANANYLGPAPLDAIATRVRSAAGMSGRNTEYVLRLAEAIRELGQSDPHVFALERLLRGDGR